MHCNCVRFWIRYWKTEMFYHWSNVQFDFLQLTSGNCFSVNILIKFFELNVILISPVYHPNCRRWNDLPMCLQRVYLMCLTQHFPVNFSFARLVLLLIYGTFMGYGWQLFIRPSDHCFLELCNSL